MLVGGEALSGRACRSACAAHGRSLTNLYGPTETTIWSAAMRHPAMKLRRACPPIGRPIWNTRVYVLDGGLSLCRLGFRGSFMLRVRGLRGAIWAVWV